MQIGEFQKEFSALEKLYGKTGEFDSEIRNEYFKCFRTLSLKQFQYIIAEAKLTCKFFPKIADLEEIRRGTNFNIVNQQQSKKETEECKLCDSRGFFLYEQLINGFKYQYVARCSCKNAYEYAAYPSAAKLGIFN